MSSPQETAQAALQEAHDEAGDLLQSYARVFKTADGQAILTDLLAAFPPDRPRFDAMTTHRNPLAAYLGGVHFDGSAAVTKHIQDRIKQAGKKREPAPEVHTTT